MKHILVPTDFSKSAENAIEFAMRSAQMIPARVTLLHTFEVSGNMYVDYMGVNKEFTATMINDAKYKLQELKKEVVGMYGIEVEIEISTESLQLAISNAVEKKKIDLIVMGTLGASGLKSRLWGSRTSSIIGKTEIPVLAIPVHYTWKKPQRILLTTNQFEKDHSILDFLFEWADLYLASVQTAVFTDKEEDKAEIYVENENRMVDYEEFLRKEYKEDTLHSTHLFGDKFEETLQNFIKENNIDILVMVTYQNNFLKRIFNPSMTKQMSFHTEVPLLAIPAKYKK